MLFLCYAPCYVIFHINHSHWCYITYRPLPLASFYTDHSHWCQITHRPLPLVSFYAQTTPPWYFLFSLFHLLSCVTLSEIKEVGDVTSCFVWSEKLFHRFHEMKRNELCREFYWLVLKQITYKKSWHINAGMFYNTSPPSPTNNQNASTWGGAAGHELGVTPNRKWAELRWRASVRWDLMSWRLLRQPLNLELIDRQFCFTPSGTERQTGGQRQTGGWKERQTGQCLSETHHGVLLSPTDRCSPRYPPR